MVDGIQRTQIAGTVGARVGTPTDTHEFFRVRRRNEQRHRDRDTPGKQNAPHATARGAAAYGQAARSGRRDDAQVVLSRSAAILVDGNLESVLHRATDAIRALAESLLGVSRERSDGLSEVFRKEAFEWVRQALARYTAYSDKHDNLPMGLTFDDVRLAVDQDLGVLDIEVGGVHFRDRFEFRAEGVVFDVRGTSVVHRPRPGFFVDTGAHGAGIADDIIAKVRTDLHEFGGGARTGGVSVMIRSDASAYSRTAEAAYSVDMDIMVPFDAGWLGEG
jgi:hypothetical protein